MQSFVDAILQVFHLVGRRTFACNKSAEYDTAVAGRQKSFRDQHKQPDCSRQTNGPNDRRYPSVSQKPPDGSAIETEDTFLEASDHPFHPGLFGAVTAFF